MRMLLNSRFGNVLVAIRENPERAEMLGVRHASYQLLVFVHRLRAGRHVRRALHDLGFLHHALDDGPHRGRDAGHLGRDLGQEEHRRQPFSAPRCSSGSRRISRCTAASTR